MIDLSPENRKAFVDGIEMANFLFAKYGIKLVKDILTELVEGYKKEDSEEKKDAMLGYFCQCLTLIERGEEEKQ